VQHVCLRSFVHSCGLILRTLSLRTVSKGCFIEVGSVIVEVIWTKQCFCDTNTSSFLFHRCLAILQYCEVIKTTVWGIFFYIGRPKIYKNKKLLFLFSKCLSLIKTPTVSGWEQAFKWMYVLYCIFMLQFGGELVQWRKFTP